MLFHTLRSRIAPSARPTRRLLSSETPHVSTLDHEVQKFYYRIGLGLGILTVIGSVLAGVKKIILDVSSQQTKALMEDIHTQFQKIDERFEKIDERFEKINSQFQKIDERFEKIDNQFRTSDQNINSQFQKIDERFERIDKRLRNSEKQMNKNRAETAKQIEKSRAELIQHFDSGRDQQSREFQGVFGEVKSEIRSLSARVTQIESILGHPSVGKAKQIQQQDENIRPETQKS